jgi:hypothetical protein
MKNFGVEPLWKCVLQRLKSRWEDNIEMNLREPCYEDSRWMRLASNCIQLWALVLRGVEPSTSSTMPP